MSLADYVRTIWTNLHSDLTAQDKAIVERHNAAHHAFVDLLGHQAAAGQSPVQQHVIDAQDDLHDRLALLEEEHRMNHLKLRAAISKFIDGLLPAIKSSDGQRSRARKRAETAEHTLDRLQVEIGQVHRKCPCGKHGYKCRLNVEPMIVSIIVGDLPEIVVFELVTQQATSRSKSARSRILCVFDGTPCLQQEAKTLHHGLLQQTDRE